jgi:quercetin dioxygenase-like cupin family protein
VCRMFVQRELNEARTLVLPGRVAHVVAGPEDGVGDLSVSLAMIAPGRMNSHRHWPAGEAMYAAAGHGRVWIEGLAVELQPGTAAFAPPCLLHNAENSGTDDLVIVGAFCPAAIPGSYVETPPIFEPTGLLHSVEHLHRSVPLESLGDTTVSVIPLISDLELSPHVSMRLVRVAAGEDYHVDVSSRARVRVVTNGSGSLRTLQKSSRLTLWSTIIAADTQLDIESGRSGLSMVEIEPHLDREHLSTVPCP